MLNVNMYDMHTSAQRMNVCIKFKYIYILNFLIINFETQLLCENSICQNLFIAIVKTLI